MRARRRELKRGLCLSCWSRGWTLALLAAAFAGATLLGGGGLVAQVVTPTPLPSPSPVPTPGLTNVGTIYYVDNDTGDDAFTCLSPVVVPPPPSGQVTGPCKTIQHAINQTRDRDLVIVAAQEPILLGAAIEVPDLIGVIATGFEPVNCQDVVGGFSKIILQSGSGGPVFHVTAKGSASLHVLIAGFILGGSTDFANPGAIVLDHDEFSEIRCTIVGQEDLPNVIGILTRGSEHPWIHDNTVHGSKQFPVSVTLGPTPPIGGFGLVTDECLGGQGRTDQLQVQQNQFTANSNAGIWICSDGSGGHLIQGNNVRSNGRGIVLLSAVDTTIRQNAIGDNFYDGVDILDASLNNLLEGNQIESQEGPSATGVLLQGSGDLFPLGTTLSGNEIRRNRVGVLVSGARGTRFVGNSITAIGERTGVLFAIGNASGLGGARFGQPTGAIFRTNKLYANGDCTALRGCAIRLLPGVTASIDATQNDFGVTDPVDIQAAIWDRARDAELGVVLFLSGPLGPPALLPITPAVLAPPALTGPLHEAPGLATASAGAPAVATPPRPVAGATVPPPSGSVAGGTSVGQPLLSGTAQPSAAPVPAAPSGASPPITYIDPGTGEYYVALTLCVTDADGQPVPVDRLTVGFFDGSGGPLGIGHVLTDSQGCVSGDVQQAGTGANLQPSTVTVTDASGGSSSLGVLLGAPLIRPPRNTLPTP